MDTQTYLTNTFSFTFTGQWTPAQLRNLSHALDRIAGVVGQLNPQPAHLWIQNYLGGTNFDQRMLLRRYYYVWRATIHLGQGFSAKSVVHEFGHILDNRLAGANAAVWGGGPADALFRAVGGNPRIGWLRFMNGARAQPYREGAGAMASLPGAARFPAGHYGNHSSADYFAETWTALILPGHTAPPPALAWMAAFVSNLA